MKPEDQIFRFHLQIYHMIIRADSRISLYGDGSNGRQNLSTKVHPRQPAFHRLPADKGDKRLCAS